MSIQLTEANEDYIEALVMLGGAAGNPVRSVDLARHMGVSKPSVTRAVALLRDAGLVTQEPYGDIFLTPEGISYGLAVYKRHLTLVSFLEDVLGVAPELAKEEACRIEHTVSEETFEKWAAFMDAWRRGQGQGQGLGGKQ